MQCYWLCIRFFNECTHVDRIHPMNDVSENVHDERNNETDLCFACPDSKSPCLCRNSHEPDDFPLVPTTALVFFFLFVSSKRSALKWLQKWPPQNKAHNWCNTHLIYSDTYMYIYIFVHIYICIYTPCLFLMYSPFWCRWSSADAWVILEIIISLMGTMLRESKVSQERLCLYRCYDISFNINIFIYV